MKGTPSRKEKRSHPRTLIRLPVDLQFNTREGGYPGLTVDASKSGLLIQSLKEISVGTRLIIEIKFPKELKLSKFKAAVEIVWKDIAFWEDWEGYQYGLRITHISKENYLKLSKIVSDPSLLGGSNKK